MSTELPGYSITKHVGTGARSRIHLAVEIETGKKYAVKRVVRNGPDDDRFLAQVENEYTVSRSLDHPYLRRSYDLRRVRRRLQIRELLLRMEYVEGLPLDKARPNRLISFLTIFRKVARGLEALHEGGWVHADIKPTNIMLGPRGVLKIIDFGQACPIGERKTRIQGTPDYIAPEQVRRMPLDRRTDVFNLGATMYWVLTSKNYPTAISQQDVGGRVGAAKADRPIPPVEHNAKIPISLSTLVMECCRENPAERPADMVQVEARLAIVEKLWRRYREGLRAKHRLSGDAEAGTKPRTASDKGEI